jgi:hypothetical protein
MGILKRRKAEKDKKSIEGLKTAVEEWNKLTPAEKKAKRKWNPNQ